MFQNKVSCSVLHIIGGPPVFVGELVGIEDIFYVPHHYALKRFHQYGCQCNRSKVIIIPRTGVFFFFLEPGMIMAFFHILGMEYALKDSWNNGVNSSANHLRRRAEIPSGPLAILVCNPLKTLDTTSGSIAVLFVGSHDIITLHYIT